VRSHDFDQADLYTQIVVNTEGEDIAACDVNLKEVTGVQQQR